MKILIDIGHPAHVHYFKNLANYYKSINIGSVLFITRDKDVAIELLNCYDFKYYNLGKTYRSRFGKLFGLFWFSFRILLIAIRFKPDIYLNATFYSGLVATLLRKPHISIEDTFNMESVRLFRPVTDVIFTGKYPHPSLGEKEIRIDAYQELLYLHPNLFTPDKTVLKELGVSDREKYVVIRFVSWKASHDYGHTGILYENKINAVKEFEKYARVFISSESELPPELEKYKIRIEPHRMHDVIAGAALLFGESFTMLAEACVLGVPAVLIHDTYCYYLRELQNKYNLAFNFSESKDDQIKAINKGVEILKNTDNSEYLQSQRQKMLSDKIDVTAFLVWFIDNYPESKRIMVENPDYQYRFK